jgi:CubicO group peptidase (beta-lactamase class C family)
MNTRFDIASMGKMYTAVSIGQLIDAGKLTLDTRLIDVLPDYPNKDAGQKITIRHLLTHSAGLGMLWERPGYDRKTPYARVTDLLPYFAAAPLNYEPGTRAAYSNEGYVVLGAVIEKLTGQTYWDYVQTHVFDVAGMKDSGFDRLDAPGPRKAVGWMFTADDPLGLKARVPNDGFVGYRGSSAGGGETTAADLVAFLKALRAGKLVSPATTELLTTKAKGSIRDYGMGFQVRAASGRTLKGHDGGGPNSGINADARIVWETGWAYAVVGNYDAPYAQALGGDIAAMIAAQE